MKTKWLALLIFLMFGCSDSTSITPTKDGKGYNLYFYDSSKSSYRSSHLFDNIKEIASNRCKNGHVITDYSADGGCRAAAAWVTIECL